MYNEALEAIKSAALKKFALYDKSKSRYFVSAIIAGFYIGLGILIMSLSQSIFAGVDRPFVKLINGFVFSMALSLVMMLGADLFTGNVMTMSGGAFGGALRGSDAVKVCAFSYVGNFVGALIVSVLFLGTAAKGTPVGDAVVGLAISKSKADVMAIFFKGIMCNIFVCLGVLACLKMKSESGKLIMIFWCILPFVALGFEHSIANMTVYILGGLLSNEVTLAMALHNLVPATIGNIVGGLLVSISYYLVGKEDK
ncbi:formate/nitrite transporter family protein [Peptoniphilus catoniae]|uniref:formate/nitrite transporter family protein n=1 Tax=Peptoniphilus catoniae TaxID=1660341 RepID=UPI0010FE8158|nr:formate/nitrite transporter family protein [Peptoniphilus catoniae]